MRRRTLLTTGLAAGAATLARPAIVRAAGTTTLKFVPYADLALLDPTVNAFVTRNHVLMVFDTLYGVDEAGMVHPQMLEGHTTSADGLTWMLTLRPGLKFHDNTPVLARDCVASLRRWAVGDAFGQALMAVTNELSAPDDKTIMFKLKSPFPLLPDALAHPTNTMAAIMPERLAKTPVATKLTEMVGSGPFRYVSAERVPGARNVYAKFEGYVPRQGVASLTAGPRVVHFDRVEWITTPDPATQVAALKSGEVDYIEQPLMDLVPSLKSDRTIRVDLVETKGLLGFLRFNQLFAPFDNPAIRRVVLKAVRQKEFMEAVTGGNADVSTQCGIFTPGTPLANNAGMEVLSGEHSFADLAKELKAAGYAGEKITYLEPTDVPRINAIAEVGADMLRKIGMNVDVIATDWGTAVQRTVNRKGPYEGGWHMFSAFTGGIDCSTPATHQLARGNGDGAYVGWPNLPKLEAIREEWLKAADLESQKKLARNFQVQAFEDVPYLPVGSYAQPVAYKASLTDVPHGLVQFTGVKRG